MKAIEAYILNRRDSMWRGGQAHITHELAGDATKLLTGNGHSPFFTMNIDSGVRSAKLVISIDLQKRDMTITGE